MSDTSRSISLQTLAGLRLQVTAQPEHGRVSASLYQRPKRAEARIGIKLGAQIAYVGADLVDLRVDTDPKYPDAIWFARTAFDLPDTEARRAQAWLEALTTAPKADAA
ncbi:hypothetical protein [Luteimonas fraxinea]|uniref:Uncharacterized protein n=1 Tax=Luteimonas fraxinea TaxID=2901869 RepID=A0ABS8UC23_9GAMM|nr:hypothetical protein [Luteimonas fraxinea]MCD9097071.1 hypothetical protein [Luteimonas fraxinea]